VFAFLRTRRWVVLRRLILVSIVLAVAYRTYGDSLTSWFRGPDPARDIVIARAEFRPDLPGAKPAWIITFRNQSRRYTYDRVQMEATYRDNGGNVLETDKMVVRQKLIPGAEQVVASFDARSRPGAARGGLKVLDAEVVK
jgi:hypothetical protein